MKIAVSIPCFGAAKHILKVIEKIGPEVSQIYVIDDKCPEGSGRVVQEGCRDPRVTVLFHDLNQGVGGATLTGFKEAFQKSADVVVKIDGDGQMDPRLVPLLVRPILEGKADYVKGNRFYAVKGLQAMPQVRLWGNAGVSFLAKLMSGYWNIMDPSNGFMALHTSILPFLETEKIDRRFFFESDLLFHLSLIRAVVVDMPMVARYENEQSNLSVSATLFSFPGKYFSRFLKRVAYRYFLRDFNFASILIVFGVILTLFSGIFGAFEWHRSIVTGIPATSGTVMLSALPVIMGTVMLLFAFLFDTTAVPTQPIAAALKSQLDLGGPTL